MESQTHANSLDFKKAKSHKGRKIIDDMKPKAVEGPKQTLFLKGNKTSETVMTALQNLVISLLVRSISKVLSISLRNQTQFHWTRDGNSVHLKLLTNSKMFATRRTADCSFSGKTVFIAYSLNSFSVPTPRRDQTVCISAVFMMNIYSIL